MLHPNLDLTLQSAFHYDKVSGDFGVELEVEGDNLPTAVSGWMVKPESSLRGNGLEYATKGAFVVSRLAKLLERLNTKLKEAGSTVRPSPRCSTHIHVNFQEETFNTFIGFLFLSVIAEPVLLRLCGPERNGNVFCMPTYETAELPAFMNQLVDGLRYKAGVFDPYCWMQRGKYAAFNTDAITRFGSVEARCFPLSVDPTQILQWVGWLENMRALARSWPDRTFKTMLDEAYTQPGWFTSNIFGYNTSVFASCAPNNVNDVVRLGVENAYELYRICRPLHDYQEKDSKVKPKRKTQGLFEDTLEVPFPDPVVDTDDLDEEF